MQKASVKTESVSLFQVQVHASAALKYHIAIQLFFAFTLS